MKTKIYKVEVPICGPVRGLYSIWLIKAKNKFEAIDQAIRLTDKPVYNAENKCKVTEQ